ncbi:phospho-sugar mutase [Mycetocola spongiae]|uniref:phospho-sugar mutase n=1 Tax=Mycetocola spongiae TaxID=2859226 RepID=UPI001CF1818F|nr:phospho-sugar mutase [Mycetocola spongiae]UCR90391.1 phospho-sugar mutase [Mycetocola spongiae]
MSAAERAELFAQAERWLAEDPDPETRAELAELIAEAAEGEVALAVLRERFAGTLSFGTAGLRGALAAGPTRMNRVVVARAAAGLSAYLNARPLDERPSLVIGYDGRKNSRIFALDSAEIAAGAGLNVILLPRALPTPVLAFAVRYFGVSAGVMVTASHNPPADNGYKVYLGDADAGSQIISPVDAEIAGHIRAVAAAGPVGDLPRSTEYHTADDAVLEEYVRATAALIGEAPVHPEVPLNVVYTAMHGVGWETFSRVLPAAGFPVPEVVPAQRDPDPAFPTVDFPNPEEDGALELSYRRAREVGADLIIANDPDADRCSIAIPDPTRPEGYLQLTGNQIGLLLGWEAARGAGGTGTLACTIVSSPALGTVAAHYGLDFVETLTGFKWVSRVPGLIFGYEEAIGYLVNPQTVRDKDGISAGLAFLALASRARRAGKTVHDLLAEFTRLFGYFASDQVAIRVSDTAKIPRLMAALRAAPPTEFAGSAVTGVTDMLRPAGGGPGTDALRFSLADGSRLMARPSGTEPKIKFYLDVQAPAERAAEADIRLAELRTAVGELVAALG